MTVLKEKVTSRDVPMGRLYYDTNIAEKRFKLPKRKKGFLYESILLAYFCLRDKRFRQIFLVIFTLIKKIVKRELDCPRHVKNAFLELGSTFIKIGQFLSSRADLLPKEYIEALSELQDSLPPVPFKEIKPQVEDELRKPLDQTFKYFEAEPIASASIGQVHKAELSNGYKVVVKIQRPNLSALFYRDLAILRCIAVYLERYTEIGKDREWVQIIDEIGKTLFEEIDFIQEGKNADHLRKNLKYEERIYIPKIFWQYTTRKLLTIEFVPGIKITDINSLRENNLNPKELALVLVNAYFKQFFEDGFYHADPHPGNIVVKNDGTIVFYDFGMVGRINKQIRAELANVLLSVIENDTDTLLNTLKKLELIKSKVDINPIKRVIEEAAYKYYDGAKLDSLDLNGLEEDLKKLFEEKPMKLPSRFTYALRATGTLEGVCRTLDPDFSLIGAAKPYFEGWIKERLIESKLDYLKIIFPNQSKIIDKIKIYVDVIKDLPKYVNDIEERNDKTAAIEENNNKMGDLEGNVEKEIKESDTKLKLAYGVIFVFCFSFIGTFLIEKGNSLTSLIGFFSLVGSFCGSLAILYWAIFKKKVLE